VPVADLISRHPQEWAGATAHAFLDGIRTGALPAHAFNTWLVQDHLFVSDLLIFQSGLRAQAPSAAQAVLTAGIEALDVELTWFAAQATQRGINLDASRLPATEAYRLAMDRWLEGGGGPALTALWALERAYLDAWRGARPGAPDYRSFVEHWTQSEFASYVEGLAAVADESPPAEAAFLEVCGLERDFWDMAWHGR
jgi:thiaminase